MHSRVLKILDCDDSPDLDGFSEGVNVSVYVPLCHDEWREFWYDDNDTITKTLDYASEDDRSSYWKDGKWVAGSVFEFIESSSAFSARS